MHKEHRFRRRGRFFDLSFRGFGYCRHWPFIRLLAFPFPIPSLFRPRGSLPGPVPFSSTPIVSFYMTGGPGRGGFRLSLHNGFLPLIRASSALLATPYGLLPRSGEGGSRIS